MKFRNSSLTILRDPPDYRDWDTRLAQHLFKHAVGNPNLERRSWYAALTNNAHRWTEPRESRISETPFQDCLEFVAETGGMYCEGFILRECDKGCPQVAIWASTPDSLVCFTHDLSMPHGIQGLPYADSHVSALFYGQAISGPYLFHSNPAVLDHLVPVNYRVLISRNKSRH